MLENLTLADRQALASALACQAVADAAQDHAAEEAAALGVEALAVALGERHGLPAVLETIGDVRRALAAWAARREIASHEVLAGGL